MVTQVKRTNKGKKKKIETEIVSSLVNLKKIVETQNNEIVDHQIISSTEYTAHFDWLLTLPLPPLIGLDHLLIPYANTAFKGEHRGVR